jgi:hypothetical protein
MKDEPSLRMKWVLFTDEPSHAQRHPPLGRDPARPRPVPRAGWFARAASLPGPVEPWLVPGEPSPGRAATWLVSGEPSRARVEPSPDPAGSSLAQAERSPAPGAPSPGPVASASDQAAPPPRRVQPSRDRAARANVPAAARRPPPAALGCRVPPQTPRVRVCDADAQPMAAALGRSTRTSHSKGAAPRPTATRTCGPPDIDRLRPRTRRSRSSANMDVRAVTPGSTRRLRAPGDHRRNTRRRCDRRQTIHRRRRSRADNTRSGTTSRAQP